MKRGGTVLLMLLAGLAVLTLGTAAQEGPPLAVGFGQFQHTVLDNDRSDFFYADAFGMMVRQVPGNPYGALPGDGALTDTPARSRLIRSGGLFGTAGMPGALSMEFVHFTNLKTTPGGARVQDPGNALLLLSVPDVKSTLDNAQKAGGVIVTDRPALSAAGAKASAVIRDPDGFLIAVSEGATLSARVGLVVENLDKSAAFYRKLGLEVRPTSSFTASGARLREMTMNGANNAPVQMLLFEFQDVDRTPLRKRLSDYGSPAMALTVRDCDAAAQVVSASSGSVYSTGGECMHQMQNGMPFNRAFVRDADGFLLEFLQRGNPTP